MKQIIQTAFLLLVLSQAPQPVYGQGYSTGTNGEVIYHGDWRALEAFTDGYLTLDHNILFAWRSRFLGTNAHGQTGQSHLFITTNATAHAGASQISVFPEHYTASYVNSGLNPTLETVSYATNSAFISMFGRHTGNLNEFTGLASANLAVRAGPPGYNPPSVVDSSPGNELSFTPVNIVRADYTPVSVATSYFLNAGEPYLTIEGLSISNVGAGPKRPAEVNDLRRGQTMVMSANVYVSDTPTLGQNATPVAHLYLSMVSIYSGEMVYYGNGQNDAVLGLESGTVSITRPVNFFPVATSDWLIVEIDPGNAVRESNEANNIRAYRIHKQPPLVLTNHPNVEAIAGGGAAIGIPISNVLEQQWFFNGAPLLGETNTTLTFTNVQPGQAGSYTLVASNFLGSVTSAPVALSVAIPPQITIQPPASLTNLVGSTAQLNVTATGTAPLAYQWRFNGAPLLSATNSTLSLTNVQPAQAGDYTVVVTNVAGAVTSSIAALTVQLVPPGIATPPAGQSFALGQNLTLTAAVSGTGPFTYQWQLNGTNLPGATSATLSLTNLTLANAGAYRLVVTNPAGTATSDAARLNFVGLNLFPVLTIADVVGSTYRIEATSDLGNANNWTTLTNLTLPHSPYLFIDPSTPQAIRRYYRAIATP